MQRLGYHRTDRDGAHIGAGTHPGRDSGSSVRMDEMLDAAGGLRPSWRGVDDVLGELGASGLAERSRAIARLLEDDGVTYRAHGGVGDQPWKLDPIPLLVDESEWAVLEPGLSQRAELLDRILADLYGPRRLISERLLPPELVFAHAGFLRAADQIKIPGGRQLFLSSTDLARDEHGQWRVLADRTQAPSGAGYAMENRSVLSRALPGLYRGTGIHRIAPFFRTMRQSLHRIAEETVRSRGLLAAPRIVLLSPGTESETAFDQAFLSSLLGIPLTVAADLTVRDGRVWQRSLHRLEPVDVILRRVDGIFCDPLELRPDSQLGVPGLVEAARAGTVAVVNSLGAGVLENPGLFPFLPVLCRALLGEDLRVQSAETFWCGDPLARAHVLSHLDALVVKPIARQIGSSSRLGWTLSAKEKTRLRSRIEAEPHSWIGQSPLAMSTAPTRTPGYCATGSGLDARPVVLRTFGVLDEDTYQLMPGGLTRVPADSESIVISNATGAISKDVWILSSAGAVADEGELSRLVGLTGPETVSAAVSPRVAEDLYWLGRYAERAEDVLRLLRVVDNRWRDVHPAPDAALARCLVTLLQTLTAVTSTWPGFVGDGAGARLSEPLAEIRSLLGDERRRGSLAHDLFRVRGLANAVRDQLSSDTWAVLSGLDRGLVPFSPPTAAEPGLTEAIQAISAGLTSLLQAMLAFSGLVAESMVRDTGWYLLDAGRRVERAQQLVGLLRFSLMDSNPADAESLVLESILIAAESIITHRRRYPARVRVDTVLELLLTDVGNPRSLAYQLGALRADLERTEDDAAAAALEDIATLQQVVGDLDLPALAATDGTARTVLSEELAGLDRRLRELHHRIDSAYFTKPGELQPLDPFSLLESA
ncbi:circularly permuted type 2 ATP-grasp protein [Jatrophihabitans telluris]|uniref:Circularly permuted type 2 ATP-grasp protein n=1 Tax=Jatrophihabitans telluris TaxID=2038343 RepID=A0ABY4QWF5_9ACTN|nr:circularly permuted type 2 ATP-grasp protein [Jatrophihabitans telluris]UQX87472.1 circularly permuted type 2 ATP-grasp protein [Jatrophihabitans telluris]